MTSVRRLLTLPGWSGVVRVLAGAAGLDAPVRAVRPVADPGAVHDVATGELIVVTGPPLAADWRLDALLRRVVDAGGAGVVVPVRATCADAADGADASTGTAGAGGGEMARATLLLAGRLGLPLLAAVAGDALELVVAARLMLAEPEIDRARLVLAAHRAFDNRTSPPEDVARRLGDLLGVPVALLDDRGQPLAGEIAEAGAVRVDEFVAQRVTLADGLLLAQPVLLPQPARPTLWLVAELRGTAAARAEIVPPALAVATAAVQRWLLAHRLELERDARARTALLGDLLRLDGEPSAQLRRRVADAGWQLGGWHVGLRIGAVPTLDLVPWTAEITRVLRAEGVEAVVVEHGDGWTGWTTFGQEPTPARVRTLASRLRAAHRKLRGSIADHMGVGRPHPWPEGLAGTVAEATDAARLAATRPEAGFFLQVDQLGMAQLLLEWTRTDTFEPAARALLAPLREQPGDLVRTLSTYLDAESSIAETAAVLGVHRNTVAARVDRIERLLGVDLGHRDERLALHLACRTVTLPGR
ncbi:helix-turn-helix domain-containing protein [Nonomuraea gerenzanensis]|uniref:Regulator of polyketide synthase expression n=1 Tax=Nonomuraea gerenzanensis TaxID=93944 RepID=A0A1M4EES7_9ACTN|nr:helix-turn-helix domain-containing protein [Nonomuraea gerenzanensis]UBU09081.1 helix-turn-helix domain-containing protein [Nonomuraea gerenzanensis]SBO97467.1 Regulator of polyketide synthase expression [Nonomuraea gerenzanensis]